MLLRVLERVQAAEPERVYVAIDGPRPTRDGDAQAVRACQQAVDLLDWSCDVQTLYRERNLGCGRAVSEAIDWFFAREERGIILEDDILPDSTFFGFISEILERDAEALDVFAVSGCNFVPNDILGEASSYRYSRIPHVWGWGTWRRAWSSYRFDLRAPDARVGLGALHKACGGSLSAMAHWQAIHTMVGRGLIDTWDYQFAFACMRAGARVATSNVNLVENTGFGDGATHTFEMPAYLRPVEEMPFPLRAPRALIDRAADAWTQRRVFEATWPGLARLGYLGLKRAVA
jgi:hypothetical protein